MPEQIWHTEVGAPIGRSAAMSESLACSYWISFVICRHPHERYTEEVTSST